MAIFHLTAKVISRGKGHSAMAKAAYNAGCQMEDERTGEKHDFTRKGGVVFEGIFAPKNAPEWARDREALWTEAERAEKRKDAQVAREVEISLPHELTHEQRRQLLTDYVRENFVRKGMVADVTMHAPDRDGDGRNHHAHILLTMRRIGPEGFDKKKAREWNSPQQLTQWRENWAKLANRYLERHGHDARIDHRSLEDQGIDREPTVHEGHTVTHMKRRGARADYAELNREIKERNARRDALKTELQVAAEEIRTAAQEEAEPTRHQVNVGKIDPALYNRADMASMQRDAMKDLRSKEKIHLYRRYEVLKAEEKRTQTKEAWLGAEKEITQQPQLGQEPQTPEKAPEQDNEKQGVQAARDGFWDEFKELRQGLTEDGREGNREKKAQGPREERQARTEQTDYQRAKAERDKLREHFEDRPGRREEEGKDRDSSGGRERERER